ncbi:unnamed protein product, partial [Meganyctiphanes norvegica]
MLVLGCWMYFIEKMGDHLDSSYDIQCPQCKTSKYRNPHMKLMVNVCGHPLCTSCVAMYFIKESGKCPECDIVLKKGKFRVQVFEDPVVEKEIDIRRRNFTPYFKRIKRYETYYIWSKVLIEDIMNLVFFRINFWSNYVIMTTRNRRKSYCKRYSKGKYLKSGMAKRSKEDEELERLIEEEKFRKEQLNQKLKDQENNVWAVRNKSKASLLQDLMASEGDAALIVAAHNERLKEEEEEMMDIQPIIPVEKKTEFSSGIRIGIGSSTGAIGAPPPSYIQASAYVYEPPVLPPCLPCPSWDDLEPKGFLAHVRKAGAQAVAGGYTEHYACLRALQDFMYSHIIHDK